ncbi:MAG: WD40/YVTN/BNR-like repeat-containing protein [Gemmatimonadaceae bacterium]
MRTSPICVAALLALPAALLVSSLVAQPLPAGDTTTLAALKWREVGPFRGGRSVAVAGSAARPWEYWFGATGGGVYKTIDGGQSWTPMSDKYFGGSIGAIGIAASNPDIVYVGTGEHAIRGNVSHGDGVWKTADGGKTWSFLGLPETHQIARVRVHPTNPDIVWVAAFGHVCAPSAERGIYKSSDGGKSWRKTLSRNDSTGATDLILDPSNPDVLYASLWQAGRTPWSLSSGGKGGGIFKSTDGGEHWTELTHNRGLPTGLLGQLGLTISGAKPSRLWALIEADSGGVYRSDDGGATWSWVSPDHRLRQRAWYYSRIFGDPRDTNAVWALNTSVYRSTDGGRNWKLVRDPHGDNHDMWIAPNDPDRLIEANDGGANVSFNGGKSWSDQDQATAQFYHVTTTNHFPYRICGAQQDNSALCGPSRWPGGVGIGLWYDPGGGESGYIQARPDDPDITYAGDNSGTLTRLDHRTGFVRVINVWPDAPDSHPAIEGKYRFQWTAPLLISPHDPHTLYEGGNRLFKSVNEGQSWTPISPDLSRHESRTIQPSGGPITLDQTTAEYYATIFTIAESPLRKGLIWAGSDDGLVHITMDGGGSWTNVTPKELPEWSRVSIIEASHHAAGTAYMATNHYQQDDLAPYIWKTTDYGKSWTKIVSGIPPTEFVRVVREDPVRKGFLFAGTERGVWMSMDDGASWQTLRRNLPVVPVHDLAIKNNDLIAATHGRSFWILDDISPLRQWKSSDPAQALHLYKPADAYRVGWGGPANTNGVHPVGMNPPTGAVIYYSLAKGGQEVTLDILDGRGTLVRSFSSRQDPQVALDSLRGDSVKKVREDSLKKVGGKPDSSRVETKGEEQNENEEKPFPRPVPPPPRVPDKQGLNMFAWNMQYSRASAFAGMINVQVDGPLALPGNYWVRIRTAGQTDSATFQLKLDPRSKATRADLEAQLAFLLKVRDTTTAANNAVLTIRNVRSQLDDRGRRIPAAQSETFRTTSLSLRQGMDSVEGAIYQVRNQSGQDPLNYPSKLVERISSLAGAAGAGDYRPTAQMVEVYRYFAPGLQTQLLAFRKLMRDDLPKVNAALRAAGLPEIVPSPTGKLVM